MGHVLLDAEAESIPDVLVTVLTQIRAIFMIWTASNSLSSYSNSSVTVIAPTRFLQDISHMTLSSGSSS